MERLYTLKELEEMKEATVEAAFDTLAKQMGKNAFTARELSEMTNGLLSSQSIAARVMYGGWYNGGRRIYSNGTRLVSGGRKFLAEIDEDGNILRKFYMKLPERRVFTYKLG